MKSVIQEYEDQLALVMKEYQDRMGYGAFPRSSLRFLPEGSRAIFQEASKIKAIKYLTHKGDKHAITR